MKKLFYFIVFLIFTTGVGVTLVYNELSKKVQFEAKSIKIEIPNNTSTRGVIKILNTYKIAEPEWLFSFLVKAYSRIENKYIFAGHYEFFQGMSNYDVLVKLYSGGRLLTKKVTIPEGLSLEKTIELLAKEVKTDKDRLMKLAYSDSLLKARDIEANNLLGYLMPETYEFFVNERAEVVIDKLIDLHFDFWTPKNRLKAKEMGRSIEEIVTLASIVEAETPYKSEGKRVAGVYLNRLKIGMLLQADPTVQFAMGKKRRVLYTDLKNPNPYNTYVHKGLPPGPINNPGYSALNAALNPEKHKYYYFVAIGDGSLKHYFSKTGSEHINYKNIYKKNREEQKKITKLKSKELK